VEAIDSAKHSSLLRYVIGHGCKKFYITGSLSLFTRFKYDKMYVY